MSQPDFGTEWYWKNYRQGMEWIGQHEVAYWKSHALSLAAENKRLMKLIHDSSSVKSKKKLKRKDCTRNQWKRIKRSKKKKLKERRRQKEQMNEEDEVEVSKELFDFFRISIKHKEELKKAREKEEEAQFDFIPPQQELDEHIEAMKTFYGEGYSKILGMETSLKLSFERYMDKKSPQYWPTLPLKL